MNVHSGVIIHATKTIHSHLKIECEYYTINNKVPNLTLKFSHIHEMKHIMNVSYKSRYCIILLESEILRDLVATSHTVFLPSYYVMWTGAVSLCNMSMCGAKLVKV